MNYELYSSIILLKINPTIYISQSHLSFVCSFRHRHRRSSPPREGTVSVNFALSWLKIFREQSLCETEAANLSLAKY